MILKSVEWVLDVVVGVVDYTLRLTLWVLVLVGLLLILRSLFS